MKALMAFAHAAIGFVALTSIAGCLDRGASPELSAEGGNAQNQRSFSMSENKKTIETYMDGFRASDHPLILSCLTDDVEWEIPGAFHIVGKEAFDKEIENDAFVGHPAITVTRMTEEDGVVVAEGSVRSQRKEGGFLNARFCDVFVMEGGKIKRLTSYLAVSADQS